VTGCALVPGVPAGPIVAGARLGGTVAYAYAPARAEATEAGPAIDLRGNGAIYGGTFSPWVPLRLAGRVRLVDFADVGVDASPIEVGLQLRAGPLAASRALPWGVELEARTGIEKLQPSHASLYEKRTYRVRAEAYPPLQFDADASDLPTSFGVLSLGVSTGTQLVSLTAVPERYRDSGEELGLATSISGLREETRLEGVVGIQWLGSSAAHTLVLLPWIALHQGALRRDECFGCYLDLLAVDSAWGFGLAFSTQLLLWGP